MSQGGSEATERRTRKSEARSAEATIRKSPEGALVEEKDSGLSNKALSWPRSLSLYDKKEVGVSQLPEAPLSTPVLQGAEGTAAKAPLGLFRILGHLD